jgi:hypothetical protein
VVLSPTQIKLTWTDSSTTETSFRVERQKQNGVWEEMEVLPTNSISYIDTGRTTGTRHTSRVRGTLGDDGSRYHPRAGGEIYEYKKVTLRKLMRTFQKKEGFALGESNL